MRRLSLAEERPDLVLQWSPNNMIDPAIVSACSHKKALWTCDNKAVIYKEFKYEDYRERMC